MTRWTEHVKGFAQEYGLSYGCAMTNALCKSSYREHYPKTAKEPKAAKAAKEPKEKKVRQKKEVIFSQAAQDMMKGDIEFFTEMASSPEHLDALINDPTIYYQGPEMKAFTQAAVLDNWARQGRERGLMAAEDRPSKNPKQVLFPASQAFIPLEEAIPNEIVSKNIMIQKPKRTQPKLKPRGARKPVKEWIRDRRKELKALTTQDLYDQLNDKGLYIEPYPYGKLPNLSAEEDDKVRRTSINDIINEEGFELYNDFEAIRTMITTKPTPRKRVPKVTAEEAMFEMMREEMPDVPKMPRGGRVQRMPRLKKPTQAPKSKKADISQENYKAAVVDLDEMTKIQERKAAPVKARRTSIPDFEGSLKERVAFRKTASLKDRVAERKKNASRFTPMEEAYPDVVSKNIMINRNVRRPISFTPMEEAYPDVVSKNITITKPKPKRKPRPPPKGTTKKQEEHDYNVSMFAQYFPEDEAFIEANVDKSNSQLKPLAVKYGVDPKEEFLFMALLKARKYNPTFKGKGLLRSRAEDAGGLTHIYPLSRGRILKLMRE